jgi:hypothetical protein
MTGRHRATGEPERNDPGTLLGALVAEPLEHHVAQAIADLTTGWLRAVPQGQRRHRRHTGVVADLDDRNRAMTEVCRSGAERAC